MAVVAICNTQHRRRLAVGLRVWVVWERDTLHAAIASWAAAAPVGKAGH